MKNTFKNCPTYFINILLLKLPEHGIYRQLSNSDGNGRSNSGFLIGCWGHITTLKIGRQTRGEGGGRMELLLQSCHKA